MTYSVRLLRLVGLAAGGLFLLIYLTYLFIPTGRINGAITACLAGQGVTLAPEARKTILPGLVWNNARLATDQGELLHFDRLRLRPFLLPLLAGRVKGGAVAELAGGKLELTAAAGGSEAATLHANGISLDRVPFFKNALGAKAGGTLWSEGNLGRSPQGMNGQLKLEVRELELTGVRLGAFPLPDVAHLRAQGMVTATAGRARLESFTLQGDGIYMRLSGEIPTGAAALTAPLNLALEIMPRAEFMEKQKLVFLLLAKFMVSPGVYRVPIRGTLLKPEIL